MLDEFIKLSQRGDALWISDVRKAFAAEPDAYRAVIRLRPHFQHSLVLQRPRAARLS